MVLSDPGMNDTIIRHPLMLDLQHRDPVWSDHPGYGRTFPILNDSIT